MRRAILFSILLFGLHFLKAQREKERIDSLEKIYHTLRKDTSRMENLCFRSSLFADMGDTLSCRDYLNQAWDICLNMQDKLLRCKNKKELLSRIKITLKMIDGYVGLSSRNGNTELPRKLYEFIIQKWKMAGQQEAVALAFQEYGTRMLVNWNEYEKASELLHQSLLIWKQLGDRKRLIGVYSALTSTNSKMGYFPRALRFAQDANSLAEELKDSTLIIQTYGLLATAYNGMKDFDKSKEYVLHTLRYWEARYPPAAGGQEKKEARKRIANLFMRLGILYYDMDSLETSIAYHNKSIAILLELGEWAHHTMELNNIALVYMKQNRMDLAMANLREAVQVRINHNDLDGATWYLNAIGDFFGEQKMADSAIAYYRKALVNINIIRNIEYEHRASFGIADALILKKEFRKAKEFSEKALQISYRINSLEKEMYSCGQLEKICFELQDYLSAYNYHKKFIALRDSMTSEEKLREIGRMESGFEWEKKMLLEQQENERQKEISRKDMRQQRIIIYGGSFVLLLMVIFTFFVISRLRITRRQKKIIELQKHLVDEKNKEVMDSIRYARRIQKALITNELYIDRQLRKLNA